MLRADLYSLRANALSHQICASPGLCDPCYKRYNTICVRCNQHIPVDELLLDIGCVWDSSLSLSLFVYLSRSATEEIHLRAVRLLLQGPDRSTSGEFFVRRTSFSLQPRPGHLLPILM